MCSFWLVCMRNRSNTTRCRLLCSNCMCLRCMLRIRLDFGTRLVSCSFRLLCLLVGMNWCLRWSIVRYQWVLDNCRYRICIEFFVLVSGSGCHWYMRCQILLRSCSKYQTSRIRSQLREYSCRSRNCSLCIRFCICMKYILMDMGNRMLMLVHILNRSNSSHYRILGSSHMCYLLFFY